MTPDRHLNLAVALLKLSRIERRTQKFMDFLGESNRLVLLDELPVEAEFFTCTSYIGFFTTYANSLIGSIHGNQCVGNHYIAPMLVKDKELQHL